MAARLKETYKSEIAPALMKKFEYKSSLTRLFSMLVAVKPVKIQR